MTLTLVLDLAINVEDIRKQAYQSPTGSRLERVNWRPPASRPRPFEAFPQGELDQAKRDLSQDGGQVTPATQEFSRDRGNFMELYMILTLISFY